MTYEFMALAKLGSRESLLLLLHYAANVEKAECMTLGVESTGQLEPLTKVSTPGMRTVEDLEEFFGRPASDMIKTLIYRSGDVVVAALVRVISCNLLSCKAIGSLEVELADENTIEEVTGLLAFAGPVGLEGCRIIADPAVRNIEAGISGGNAVDVHLKGINPKRDFTLMNSGYCMAKPR